MWITSKYESENLAAIRELIPVTWITINAFMLLGTRIFALVVSRILMIWKSIKKAIGRRENFLPGILIGVLWGKNEKIGVCLKGRLHACIAFETKIENNFVLASTSMNTFTNQRQLLPPDALKSVFRIKIYFSYSCVHDASLDAQTTRFSYDFVDERATGKGLSKPLEAYNGYIYLIKFLYGLHLKGHLKTAKIYNNRSVEREELKVVTPGNIASLMQDLIKS